MILKTINSKTIGKICACGNWIGNYVAILSVKNNKEKPLYPFIFGTSSLIVGLILSVI